MQSKCLRFLEALTPDGRRKNTMNVLHSIGGGVIITTEIHLPPEWVNPAREKERERVDFKILALCLMAAANIYRIFLSLVNLRSAKKPIPENVKDIYDEETYQKWRSYNFEKTRIGIIETAAAFLIHGVMFYAGAYPWVVNGIGNVYLQSVATMTLFILVDALTSLPFAYFDTMVIEQKYGFNKATRKTFLSDQLKQTAILFVIVNGLLCLLALIHRGMGDWILVLFTGILMAFGLAATFLAPIFTRIFNTFTPLPDGPLKEKLTALLQKYGYRVKSIDVMDASKRTTKSNAYFTGFGKMKTIVLYDTLLNSMDEDEVCAVFAHEMGHGIHKDTLKMQLGSMVNFVAISAMLWLTVRSPEVLQSFGFIQVDYGFAAMLMLLAEMPVIQPLLGLGLNAYSRHAEFRADHQAAVDGYGKGLVSALKKLARENFADLAPSELLVKLEYSHPPISDRIAAIEKEE